MSKARARLITLLRDRAGLYEPFTVYANSQERIASVQRVMPYRIMISEAPIGSVLDWLDNERGLFAGRDYAYSNRHFNVDGWSAMPLYFRSEKEAIFCKMFWC